MTKMMPPLEKQQTVVYWIIFCAGLGGILYGYDIGVISGALLFIRNTIPLTDLQTGYIVGAVLGGGFVANLFTGPLADRFGRRNMIIIASLIFIMGVGIITQAHDFWILLIARLLLGIGVGIISVAIPLYITEVAPAAIRGAGVTAFQLFLTFGILLAYFVDWQFAKSENWVGMFLVILIPATILLMTMFSMPQSPRWLVAKGRVADAETVLKRIRPRHLVAQELNTIKNSFDNTQSGFRELFTRPMLKPLFIALFIAASNQLTGINSIFQYAPLIFKQSGITSHNLLLQNTVLLGLVNFLTCLLALFLIDRVGRKKLLVIGTGGLVILDMLLGGLLNAPVPPLLSARLQLIGLGLWVFFYAIGPGVVVWLVFSELFPTRVRAKSVALCLFLNSLCSALLSSFFLIIIDHLGMAKTYWLLGFFTFLYYLVAHFLLPETKGKSLEEIQTFFTPPSFNSATRPT